VSTTRVIGWLEVGRRGFDLPVRRWSRSAAADDAVHCRKWFEASGTVPHGTSRLHPLLPLTVRWTLISSRHALVPKSGRFLRAP
jgi:hypothetical protein